MPFVVKWRRGVILLVVALALAGCAEPTEAERRAAIFEAYSEEILQVIDELAATEETRVFRVDFAHSSVILQDPQQIDLRVSVEFASGCRWVGVAGYGLDTDTPSWNAGLTPAAC